MNNAKEWTAPTLHVLCTSVDGARNGGPSDSAIDLGSFNYANDPVSS